MTVKGTGLQAVNALSLVMPYDLKTMQYTKTDPVAVKDMRNMTYDLTTPMAHRCSIPPS